MAEWDPHLLTKLEELPQGITQLLGAWEKGDQDALNEVVGLLYNHLHGEAKRHLDKLALSGDTLQPTVLVNEAYLKFRKKDKVSFLNRQQFFWFTSKMIRHIIVDHIRSKTTQKRAHQQVPLNEAAADLSNLFSDNKLDPAILLAINELLNDMEKLNPRWCQLVTLRFILGTSIQETAEIMELSKTTVKAEWVNAKHWLFKKLNPAFS